MSLLRAASAGILVGAVWGVFLRVFMRLLVFGAGEFSWSGTLMIIGFSAAAGLGLALVRWGRRSGRSPAWRCAALLAAPLVLTPQGIAFLLPALLLGGLIISRRPPRWLRVVLAAALLLPPPLLFLLVEMEPLGMPLPIVLTVLYTLMIVLGVGGAEIFRPWRASTAESTDTAGGADAASVAAPMSLAG